MVALILLSVGCSNGAPKPSYLEAAPEPYRNLTHAPLIELPDSGGVLINGFAISRDSLAPFFWRLHELPRNQWAVFFTQIGAGRLADAAWFDSLAQRFEIQTYSAHATWPNAGPPSGFRVIGPDEDL
jgi:hypothetical protein